ncbi:branched-chain amino acid ABC transporter substrate-binding protein [Actinophytocola algeriensis]|uniref:Branched-chain amino acid transport system substrate-binding protein n=1 Tax=Actinophytocola algeriensis TaxID=1768010 RepID=A0A7W7QF54_9PSEU|nr:branched-chain amino acid ABC transporter substrate-binding protein [Actinophytocola algeriensis]MBB4912482.1 branched-chain amino acid transport system substrate-binding protein [Actinophytocola algeriensis]MBE1480945.1 branched-chain amino acid transport system substrate-binding protein [Actinophytocola algeriensis]
MRNQTVKAAAVVAAGLLLLSACGTNKEEGGSEGGGGNQSCDVSKGTLTLGVIAPLSGELSALGKGIENSAKLAVDQANEKCAVKGYKLALQAEDDQKTPQLGAQAATKLASTPNVVGVVSTLNSSVSQSVQPILDGAGILQISPANTADSLTKGEDPNNPKRPYPTYFRTCTVDSLQGPFAANYLIKKSGKKKIAIITDGLTYGEGLADSFTKQAEKNGAEIVTRQKIGEKDTDFSGVIAAVKPFAPDGIYYGGQYPQAGPLSKQFAGAGLSVPVMGGDGIFDPQFIALGGKDGDLATSVGAPTEELESAKAFVDAYNKAGYKEGFSAYGAFSYDAANVIIAAVGKAIGDGEWADDMRADVVKAAQDYSGEGATGELAFDENGDSTNTVLTVYQVTGGEWKSVETGKFEG